MCPVLSSRVRQLSATCRVALVSPSTAPASEAPGLIFLAGGTYLRQVRAPCEGRLRRGESHVHQSLWRPRRRSSARGVDDHPPRARPARRRHRDRLLRRLPRSEEHASELQSLMRISYAVFCLKKKKLKKRQKNL